jgi:hypothetical protein
MKRIVRLTESDLARIVKRVIREQEEPADEMVQGIEKLNNELVDKSVNFYSKPSQKQSEYMRTYTIKRLENVGSLQPVLQLELDPASKLTFTCSVNKLRLNNNIDVFNKMLLNKLKDSGFCQKMRDNRGNMKTVPNSDFASTVGDMGGMA